MRIIRCAYCCHPSVNQYGTSPFNQLGQVIRWPSVFLHETCMELLVRDLRELSDSISEVPLETQLKRVL